MPGLLASKHFTIVVGIDMHFTTLPPFNPIHPYIGIVFDASDYIPFLGASTYINHIPRGVSDTSGKIGTFIHIPIATGPFAMQAIIGHESTNFFGGINTYAEGRRLSPTSYMIMTCNDIGIPLSLRPGKKFIPIPTLFAPTSYSIPIPGGMPVFVGGPYVPDWGAILMNMAVGFGMGCLMKGAGALLKKAKGLNKKASNLMSGIESEVKTPAKPKAEPKVKPDPPFKKNPKHNPNEFNKQLKNQEDAINEMKTKEWLKNREDFKNRNKTDYNKKSKQARDDFRGKETEKRAKDYMKNNPDASYSEAQQAAKDSMKGDAALHNPDGIAGGKAEGVTGMGDKNVNSSIGSQWQKGRAESIENQVKSQYGIPPKTINDIPDNAMMNVDLS